MKIRTVTKYLVSILILSFVLSSCFSSWQEETGSFSISIGGSSGANARSLLYYDEFSDWPNQKDDVWYKIIVSTGLGEDDVRMINDIDWRGHTERFEVSPGLYEITVEAYDTVEIPDASSDAMSTDNVLYGIGSDSVIVTAGVNIDVDIEMEKPSFTVTFDVKGEVFSFLIEAGTLLSDVVEIDSRLRSNDDGYFTWEINGRNVEENLNYYVYKDMTVKGVWHQEEHDDPNTEGNGSIEIKLWVNEDDQILDGGYDAIIIPQSGDGSLDIEVNGDYENIRYTVWGYIDEEVAGPSFTIYAADFDKGNYKLVVIAYRDNVPYSVEIDLTVK